MQCTSDIVASLGHPFLATISDCPLHIRPEYNRINVFCTRKSGHYIQMATINVATISGVHCTTVGTVRVMAYDHRGVENNHRPSSENTEQSRHDLYFSYFKSLVCPI